MAGQFDKETSNGNFEWHRERVLREKNNPNAYTSNRVNYNMKAIETKHGTKAAKEIGKEFNGRSKTSGKKYYS